MADVPREGASDREGTKEGAVRGDVAGVPAAEGDVTTDPDGVAERVPVEDVRPGDVRPGEVTREPDGVAENDPLGEVMTEPVCEAVGDTTGENAVPLEISPRDVALKGL